MEFSDGSILGEAVPPKPPAFAGPTGDTKQGKSSNDAAESLIHDIKDLEISPSKHTAQKGIH